MTISSIIINIKLYNPKNYFKPKLFVTKINGLSYLELTKKINKIKNWKQRVCFVKSIIKNEEWIKLPKDHGKISEIKFILMKYDETRVGKWGPVSEIKFSNPKKIMGIIKSLVQFKKMINRKSYVWV